jgi:hypothetical protein
MPLGVSALVVEEYRNARDMLAEYLPSRGFIVHVAADGHEAISVAFLIVGAEEGGWDPKAEREARRRV